MAAAVIAYPIVVLDDARRMIHWLARRRRLPLRALVDAAPTISDSLVSFASLDEASPRRTKDVNVGQLLTLLAAHEHRLVSRPVNGDHPVVHHPGALPLQIRDAGGELLEVPVEKLDDVAVLAHTLAAIGNMTITALSRKAGISQTITSFASGSSGAGDLRLRPLIDFNLAGGFEFAVKPIYANVREARLAQRRSASPLSSRQQPQKVQA
jgi:hypothetical protein